LLTGAYAELAGLLLASTTFDELTQQVAELAARTVPVAATCAITVAVDGRPLTVAAADGLGRLLDEQQYVLDEGPCLQAVRTREPVRSDDLATDTRWDGYPARALAHGIGAVYSVPLLVGGRALGALNMFAGAAHAFDAPARDLIGALGNLAAAGMAGALANYDEITLTGHLRRALSTRGVIDQAIGIVIAHQHCTPAQAFDVLRGISQARNIRLHQIAAELVERTATQPQALDPRDNGE
jgi:GAF domain-containing protein